MLRSHGRYDEALYQSLLSTSLKSNSVFMNLIQTGYLRYQIDMLRQLLKEPSIQDKLARATNFYQRIMPNSPSRAALDKGTYKWGGKDTISALQKEFILTLSNKLDLDEKQTFELADLYFARNPAIYGKLTKYESSVQVYSQSLATVGQPAVAGTQDIKSLKLQEYTDELKAFLRSLTIPMTELYYEERLSILKASVALASAATISGHPLQEEASVFMTTITQKKNYESVLWDIYFNYKNKAAISQKLPLEERERFFLQLMKEEFCTLQFFFVLYFQSTAMTPATYIKMLNHFNETQFQGGVSYYYKDSSEPHIASFAKEINVLIREIIDLSVLLAIEGLKLDTSRKFTDTLKKPGISSGRSAGLREIDAAMQKLPPHAYNTPVQLAWRAFCETMDDSTLKQLAISEESETKFRSFEGLHFIFEMRMRELFNDPQINALKSAFINVLSTWLSVICSVFKLKSLPSYSEVVPFAIDLLQDPQSLQVFWEEDFPQRDRLYKILEEMQANFPYQCIDMINLLITLCGNEDLQYVKSVVYYLQHFTGYTHILGNQEITMQMLRESDSTDRLGERSYISKDEIITDGITIPVNTRAVIIEKRRPSYLLLRWDITYSAWPILFATAEKILSGESLSTEAFEQLTTFIRLICKIIELDPSQAANIEGLSIPEQMEMREDFSMTVSSVAKTLNLFGKSLQYMAQQGGNDCLIVAQSIVDAICKLYGADDLRGGVVRFIENSPRLYAESHYSTHGQLHPLVLLFRNFREQEIALRSTRFSQAVLHFAITLLADPYLSDNFSSAQSSPFISDLLQFVFDEIIRNFDSFEGRSVMDHLFLMKGVVHFIYTILLKYRNSPTKLAFEYGTKKNQPLLSMLTHFLNRFRVSQILLKTIRVKLTYKDLQVSGERNEYAELGIQNRLWNELSTIGKLGSEEKKQLKKTIALCLAAISLVLGMVHQQRLWILQFKKEEKMGYEYFQDLGIVGEFYNYFYDRAELPTFYEESSRSIERTPINLVLAIVSYISFESDNILQVDSPPQESPDVLLPPKSFSYNVNQNALICLTKILLIWEQYPNVSRPSLLGYLDYSKTELYSQSEYTFGRIHSELNCTHKLREEIYTILSSYSYNPEVAIAVLELLMVAIHSQRSFCELIIRSEGEKHLADRDFVTILCKSLSERTTIAQSIQKIDKVYGSWIILLAILLENENGNEALIRKIHKHNLYSSALVEIHKTVVEYIIPTNQSMNASARVKSFANESNKSFKLSDIRRSNHFIEELVQDECFSLFVQFSYLGILIREMLRNADETTGVLRNLLEQFFNEGFSGIIERITKDGLTASTWKICSDEYEMLKRCHSNDFLRRLDRVTPIVDSQSALLTSSYSDFNTALYIWTLSPAIGTGTITKWFWNTLSSVNDYGYGRNWCIDTLELWTEIRSILPLEVCQSTVWAMSKYNLEASLQDIENKCIIFFNQLMTLLVVESGREQLQVPSAAQAVANYAEQQDWDTVTRRYIQLINSLWESLRLKITEEVLTPLDMYKLQQKMSTLTLCYNGLSLAYRKMYEKHERKTNEENRVEEFRQMTEMKLADVIPDLRTLLRGNILCSYMKYNNEQLLSSFNIQLVAFMQFIIDSQIELNKYKEIGLLDLVQPLGEELEIAIRISSTTKSTNFLPLVVSSLEQIIHIVNDEIYVNIFEIERSKLIKLLLNRLISPECTQSDFLSILKFFIAYSSKVKGAHHLYEEKILQTLCMIPSFKDIVNVNEYEENQRTNTHILWCWTLFLVRCLFSTSSSVPGFFTTALWFLRCFEGRIVKILRFQGYSEANNRPIKYTLAYVEELEYTIGLINQYLNQYEKWKYENNEQYEEFIEIIFKYTIKIYSSNVVLTELYIPISETEKWSANLFAKDLLSTPRIAPKISVINSPRTIPKILTSVRSPTKDEYFKPHDTPIKLRRSLSHVSAEESDRLVQGYNPNIFHMRVEISLNRTLLYTLSGLIEPIYAEVQQVESSFSGRMKEYSAAYGSRWNEDLFRLMDCGLFGVHSYEKCVVNYKELELLLKRMNEIYGSVEASVKCGTLNHLHIGNLDVICS